MIAIRGCTPMPAMSALGVRNAIQSSISWVSFVLDMSLTETDVVFYTCSDVATR
jgi:hypothetical protein